MFYKRQQAQALAATLNPFAESFVLQYYFPYSFFYTIRFKSITPIKPTTEIIDSIIVHERIVSFIERLKYSLNNQKPESFTCEQARLPAPIESTIRFGLTPLLIITGAIMPAVVKPATVAEPTHIL